MRLHTDKAAFGYIIDEVSSQHGIRRDVLEKRLLRYIALERIDAPRETRICVFQGGNRLVQSVEVDPQIFGRHRFDR